MIGFTPLECGIAACVLEGMGSTRTAAAVGVSEARVRHCRKRLMHRFRVRNWVELGAVLLAIDRQDQDWRRM